MSELRLLSEKQKVPVDLDTYIKKLANSRKRIMLVNDILQNVQVRCQTWQGRSHQYGWSGFNRTTFQGNNHISANIHEFGSAPDRPVGSHIATVDRARNYAVAS